MKRVGVSLVVLVAIASIGGVAAASSPAPPPDDPASFVDAFASWAATSEGPVTVPACHVPVPAEPPVVTCFGLRDGAVVIATITIEATGRPGDVVALELPAAPTSSDAASGTTPAPVATATDGAAAPFGPGVQAVGSDIVPGRYTAMVPADSAGCYWERLAGFSGELSEVIETDSATAGEPVVVDIAADDAGFASNGCGTWTPLA